MRMIYNASKKYTNLPVAAKAALWFVVCEVIQKCISMITVPIFTRVMDTSEYGDFGVYLSIYNVLTVVCTLNMERCIYLNKLAKASSPKESDKDAISLLSLAFVFTCLISTLVCIYTIVSRDFFGLSLPFVLLAITQVLFDPAIRMWNTRLRYQYRYKTMVIVTLLFVIFNTTLGLIAVFVFKDNQAFARSGALVFCNISLGLAVLIGFWKRGGCFFSTKDWKHVLSVQLPLLPHSLSLTLLGSCDRIMIKMISGSYYSAIYSVSYTAGYIVSTLKNSIVSAIEPWLYRRIKEQDEKSIIEVTNPLLSFVLILTIMFSAFAPEMVRILAPSQYYEAIYIIPPVALSSYFTFLYNLFSVVSFYYEDTKKIMVASVSSATLNILLNYIFINMFGYIAAGYTTLACYIFLALVHHVIMKNVIKKHIGNWKPFDTKFIVLCSLIACLFVGIFATIYNFIIIRYSIVLIILLYVYAKRNTIITTFNTIREKNS